jgi:DNA-binding SARP family transcriptional activator/tetratricopeptide (TPR) repeat protein
MPFGVLGPLLIRVGDGEVPMTAHRDRVLLAMLLLHANRPVGLAQLVDALWDIDPPSTARAQVHSCISRLRRILPPGSLHTDPAGYLLRVVDDELDLLEFEALTARARGHAANGRPVEAVESFRSALALWRGAAFAGIQSAAVAAAAARWQELRSLAWEECVDLELSTGRAAELIGELTETVHEYPTRERPRAQLMLALYRCGRQVDALAAFREGRQVLIRELGVEPGAELSDLHRRILYGDPSLLLRTDEVGDGAHSLPRDISDFSGRDDVLARLVEPVPAATVVPLIHAIDGMAGIGKTALAVRAAHLVAHRYPDAQLYIDLHGHSDRAPVEPVVALDVLLRQLGVPGGQIPEGLDARMARWRSELAGRRVVLLLDNAANSEQVGPLLPGGPGGLTLITSRRRLVGLDGVRPVSLDALSADEAVALLHRIVGERVTLDQSGAAEVARLCGYLALAIRLAAARLAHRPGWTVQDLVTRLGSTRPVLAEIAAEGRTLSAAFALSYQQVDEPQRRMFRLLALHPGGEFGLRAAAALADLAVDQAAVVLDHLVDAHLVQEPRANRYRLHDLLREYALALIGAEESSAAQREAVRRLLDYYMYSAAAMSKIAETLPVDYNPPGPVPPQLARPGDLASSFAWFAEEHRPMIAVIKLAAEMRFDAHVWRLVNALWGSAFRSGHTDDLLFTHELALRSAQRGGEELGIAVTRSFLASAYFRLGRGQVCLEQLRPVLDYAQRVGDREREMNTLYLMGLVYFQISRYPEAMDHLQRGLDMQNDDARRLSLCYAGMGNVLQILGRYAEALYVHQRSLDMAMRAGSRVMEASALGHIGVAQRHLGEWAAAEDNLLRAAELKARLENPIGRAETLGDLGILYRHRGDLAGALNRHRQSLDVMPTGSDLFVDGALFLGYAGTLRAAGDRVAAREMYQRVLDLAPKIGNRLFEGRALAGLSRVETDDQGLARDRWDAALKIFVELGVPVEEP